MVYVNRCVIVLKTNVRKKCRGGFLATYFTFRKHLLSFFRGTMYSQTNTCLVTRVKVDSNFSTSVSIVTKIGVHTCKIKVDLIILIKTLGLCPQICNLTFVWKKNQICNGFWPRSTTLQKSGEENQSLRKLKSLFYLHFLSKNVFISLGRLPRVRG